jgi:hypothetical protein
MIHVELDVKRSSVPHYCNIMDIIYFTLTTEDAIFQFQVNKSENLVRVTKMILKAKCQGEWHRSTLMTVDAGRKLVRQLQAR